MAVGRHKTNYTEDATETINKALASLRFLTMESWGESKALDNYGVYRLTRFLDCNGLEAIKCVGKFDKRLLV